MLNAVNSKHHSERSQRLSICLGIIKLSEFLKPNKQASSPFF